MMNPRFRTALQWGALLVALVVLFLIFPAAFAFVELAARELRYLWWLVLLVALALWLIWGTRHRPGK